MPGVSANGGGGGREAGCEPNGVVVPMAAAPPRAKSTGVFFFEAWTSCATATRATVCSWAIRANKRDFWASRKQGGGGGMVLLQGLKGLAAWVRTKISELGNQDRLERVLLLLDGKLGLVVDQDTTRFDPRALYCARDMTTEQPLRNVCGSVCRQATSRLAVDHGMTTTVVICTWVKAGDPTERYHLAPACVFGDQVAAAGKACTSSLVPLPPWRNPLRRQAIAGLRFAGIRLRSTGEVIDLTKEYKRLTVPSGGLMHHSTIPPELAVYLLYQLVRGPNYERTLTDCEFIFTRGVARSQKPHA